MPHVPHALDLYLCALFLSICAHFLLPHCCYSSAGGPHFPGSCGSQLVDFTACLPFPQNRFTDGISGVAWPALLFTLPAHGYPSGHRGPGLCGLSDARAIFYFPFPTVDQ